MIGVILLVGGAIGFLIGRVLKRDEISALSLLGQAVVFYGFLNPQANIVDVAIALIILVQAIILFVAIRGDNH